MKLSFIFRARPYFFDKMPYYAVAQGRNPGIYGTWDECNAQVNKFSGSIYKKFSTEGEAQNFVRERSSSSTAMRPAGENPNVSIKFPILQKQSFSTKNKPTTVTQKTLSSSVMCLKRSLSTNKNSNESSQLRKIRKISDSASTECSKQGEISEVNFITDVDGYINVFTDGACSSNGYKNARAGIGVWFQDNHPLNVSRPVEGRATNNMAEIQAVTVAARQAKKAGIKKLKINTDSKFLISCITEWMPRWKKKGWTTADNKPVINKFELLEMEKALESLTVAWNHVNGHVGIHGNEMADKLAREGCLHYKNENFEDI